MELSRWVTRIILISNWKYENTPNHKYSNNPMYFNLWFLNMARKIKILETKLPYMFTLWQQLIKLRLKIIKYPPPKSSKLSSSYFYAFIKEKMELCGCAHQ